MTRSGRVRRAHGTRAISPSRLPRGAAAGGARAAAMPQATRRTPRHCARARRPSATSLGDYRLVDQHGRPLRVASLRGRPLVLSFVYTNCYDICSGLTLHLRDVVRVAREALGPRSFSVLTVGFDTAHDSPERMLRVRPRPRHRRPGLAFRERATRATIRAADRRQWASPGSHRPAASTTSRRSRSLDARRPVVQQVYGQDFAPPELVEPLKALAARSQPSSALRCADSSSGCGSTARCTTRPRAATASTSRCSPAAIPALHACWASWPSALVVVRRRQPLTQQRDVAAGAACCVALQQSAPMYPDACMRKFSATVSCTMVASLITFVLLGWHPAVDPRVAARIAISPLASPSARPSCLIGGPFVRSVVIDHVPVWVPPLPFALIAITLFGFGLLAWFWSED